MSFIAVASASERRRSNRFFGRLSANRSCLRRQRGERTSPWLLKPLLPLAFMMLLLPVCMSTDLPVEAHNVVPNELADNEIPTELDAQVVVPAPEVNDNQSKEEVLVQSENELEQNEGLTSTIKTVSELVGGQLLDGKLRSSNEISKEEKISTTRLGTTTSSITTTTEVAPVEDPIVQPEEERLDVMREARFLAEASANNTQSNEGGGEKEDDEVVPKKIAVLQNVEEAQLSSSSSEVKASAAEVEPQAVAEQSQPAEVEPKPAEVEPQPAEVERQPEEVEPQPAEVETQSAAESAESQNENASDSNSVEGELVVEKEQPFDVMHAATESTPQQVVTTTETPQPTENEDVMGQKAEAEQEERVAEQEERVAEQEERVAEQEERVAEQEERVAGITSPPDGLSITFEESLTATDSESEQQGSVEVKVEQELAKIDSEEGERPVGDSADVEKITVVPESEPEQDEEDEKSEIDQNLLRHNVIKKQGVDQDELPASDAVENEREEPGTTTAPEPESGGENATEVQPKEETLNVASELPEVEASKGAAATTVSSAVLEMTTEASDDDDIYNEDSDEDPIARSQAHTEEGESAVSTKGSRSIISRASAQADDGAAATRFDALPPPDAGQTFNDNLAAESAGGQIVGKALPTQRLGGEANNRSTAIILACSGTALLFVVISVIMFMISFQRQHGTLDIEMQERRCGKDDSEPCGEGAARIQLLEIELPPPQTDAAALLNGGAAAADEEPDECL